MIGGSYPKSKAMKKVIAIFSLLCVICFSTTTFSQNSFQDLIKQFGDTNTQLNYILQDLLKITEASSNQDELFFLSSITKSISSSENTIDHARDLFFLYPSIKDDRKPNLHQYFQISLLNLKKQIEGEIESIQLAYAGIKNRAALHLIDQAKEKMRGSLILIDRGIEFLKLDKITKSKK